MSLGAPTPVDEAQRLRAVRVFSAPNATWREACADAVRLASILLESERVCVTLVSAASVEFLAGWSPDLSCLPRNASLCGMLVDQGLDELIVEDAVYAVPVITDPSFVIHHGVRFYAGFAVRTPSGHTLGALCVTDEEPRRLTSQQIEGMRALAASVSRAVQAYEVERSLERANLDLLSLGEDALAAARCKSALLDHLSHEIRTPMNGVIGVASLLKETPLDDQQRLYVETIEQSAAGLMNLLAQVLEYGDELAGSTSLVIRTCDIREVLAEVESMMRPMALERGLSLTSIVSAAIPGACRTDPLRLRQILLHLVARAMPVGARGHVQMRAKRAGDSIRFEVTSTVLILEEPSDALVAMLELLGSSLREDSGPLGSTSWFDLAAV